MLTLRNLLMASAIAACATAAVAQTAAPPAPDPTAAPAQAPMMIPIPCTDFSRMNRCNDPLVQARAARSGEKTESMSNTMGNMPGMSAPQPTQ